MLQESAAAEMVMVMAAVAAAPAVNEKVKVMVKEKVVNMKEEIMKKVKK